MSKDKKMFKPKPKTKPMNEQELHEFNVHFQGFTYDEETPDEKPRPLTNDEMRDGFATRDKDFQEP